MITTAFAKKNNDPASWDFAVWNNESPKRIIALNFPNKNLTEFVTKFVNEDGYKLTTSFPAFISGYDTNTVQVESLMIQVKCMGYTTVFVGWKTSQKVAFKDNGNMTISFVLDKDITVTPIFKDIPTPVESVKLNKKSLTLAARKTYNLKATIEPFYAPNQKITWTSSNKKVVTVTSKGKIKALKKGEATITVQTANGKKAKCVVTVK